MIIPVRCITCGRPISHKWDKYAEGVSKGKAPKKMLDELGVKSYCCRNMFLTHMELIDEIGLFKKKFIPKSEEVREAEVRIIAAPVMPETDVVPEVGTVADEDAVPEAEEKK